jgi:hypothetical protein
MKSSATDHVEEIILALPLGDGHDKARAMATARLMIQAGMAFGRINDLPRARDAGTRQTERELRDLIKRAVNLARHISDMHSPALRAIEAQSPKMEPLSLVDLLGSLVGAAESAIDRLPTDAAPVRKGRYENRTALDLAGAALGAYEWYTGKRATITTHPVTSKRSGKFLDFVSAVFSAAQVDADPVHFAKEVIRPKKPPK